LKCTFPGEPCIWYRNPPDTDRQICDRKEIENLRKVPPEEIESCECYMTYKQLREKWDSLFKVDTIEK
jgi:hypothetical protein